MRRGPAELLGRARRVPRRWPARCRRGRSPSHGWRGSPRGRTRRRRARPPVRARRRRAPAGTRRPRSRRRRRPRAAARCAPAAPGVGEVSITASPIVLTSRTGGSTTSRVIANSRSATEPRSSGAISSPRRVNPTRSANATLVSRAPRQRAGRALGGADGLALDHVAQVLAEHLQHHRADERHDLVHGRGVALRPARARSCRARGRSRASPPAWPRPRGQPAGDDPRRVDHLAAVSPSSTKRREIRAPSRSTSVSSTASAAGSGRPWARRSAVSSSGSAPAARRSAGRCTSPRRRPRARRPGTTAARCGARGAARRRRSPRRRASQQLLALGPLVVVEPREEPLRLEVHARQPSLEGWPVVPAPPSPQRRPAP